VEEPARSGADVGTRRRQLGEHTVHLYLDLLKKALSRGLFDPIVDPLTLKGGTLAAAMFRPLRALLATKRLVLGLSRSASDVFAESPPLTIASADTLIGPVGLDNLQRCIEDVLLREVPGDFIEAGVWRGGSVIFMRGALKAYGDDTRTVWAADSFRGLPSPEVSGYAQDATEKHWARENWMAVSLEEVKQAFVRYGLLDDRVRFLVGWFHETLPNAPIERLALIRLDADMYGSTMDALRFLYPKLSPAGYVIIDDYWLPGCRAAVDDYRAEHGITEELVPVDRAIVYWQRAAA
jgi:O-methyltransferase